MKSFFGKSVVSIFFLALNAECASSTDEEWRDPNFHNSVNIPDADRAEATSEWRDPNFHNNFVDSDNTLNIFEKWMMVQQEQMGGIFRHKPSQAQAPALLEHKGSVREFASCPKNCKEGWLGDGMCDVNCNIKECGFDKGDCDHSDLSKIVFLHMRKTGGTTLHKYLGSMYSVKGAKVCRIFSFEQDTSGSCGYRDFTYKRNTGSSVNDNCQVIVRQKSRDQRACDDCIQELDDDCVYVELRHWDYSLAEQLQKKGFKIVTLMRDPVRLLESSYNYEAMSRNDALGSIPGYPGGPNGFREWTKDRLKIRGFDAMRILSGCWPEHAGGKALNDSKVPDYCTIQPTYSIGGEIEEKMKTFNDSTLEEIRSRALKNLFNIDFVGITEQFELSTTLLHRMFFNKEAECHSCEEIRQGSIKGNVNTHMYTFDSLGALGKRVQNHIKRTDNNLYKAAKYLLKQQGASLFAMSFASADE